MNLGKIIGPKGAVVQQRMYLRNKLFKKFVDERLAERASANETTATDEFNYILARALLPDNERAARYVFRVYTEDGYGVYDALGDIFYENAGGVGSRAVYPGMYELVDLFVGVSQGTVWPKDCEARAIAAEAWPRIDDAMRSYADGAPVEVRFGMAQDLKDAPVLAKQLSSPGCEVPGVPCSYVRIIARNWEALRGLRCTYEFLYGLVAACDPPRERGASERNAFYEAVERTFARWDAGEDEPPVHVDDMVRVELSGGSYLRVPGDFVLLNAKDAAFSSDAVVVEARGADFPHFVYFCDDAAGLIQDDDRRKVVFRAVSAAQEGFSAALEEDRATWARERVVNIAIFRLPDADKCQSCPPCGAAIYRPPEGGPMFR